MAVGAGRWSHCGRRGVLACSIHEPDIPQDEVKCQSEACRRGVAFKAGIDSPVDSFVSQIPGAQGNPSHNLMVT